jgi:acyl-CoA-binding protein
LTPVAVAAAETTFNNEARLLFYALHKQAAAGPCKEGKPWSWNVVESAKWQSWSQLGDMSSMDAMRLYVKTLDEEQVRLAGKGGQSCFAVCNWLDSCSS